MRRIQRICAIGLALALGCAAVWAEDDAIAPENSRLDRELFYELLVAEISVQGGEPAAAYSLMLDAARKSASPRLYERAVELALRARNGDLALQAAQYWSRAFADSVDANRYVLQILVGLNRSSETGEPIKRILAALPINERAGAISQFPRYLSRATDLNAAAVTLEQALATELQNTVSGPAAWAAIGRMRLFAGKNAAALAAAEKGAALNAAAEEPVALAVDLIDPSLPDAQKMVALYLKGPARPEIRLAYTRKLLDASRYADAREQMQYVTTHTPEFADAWLVRGSLELQDQQWNEAKASLKTYLERSAPEGGVRAPESERGAAQAYLLLAQIAEHEQDYEVALAYLDQVDSAQDGFRVEVRRAMILARQGKLAQARALIQGIEEDQPEDARAKISAEVQMLREFHLYPDVYQVLSQAVKRFAQDYDFIYDLAMAAEKIGKIDEMESLLRQVIAARPDYPHAYNALGYSLADRNLRLPEARQLIARALEFAPNDPYIVDSMGWVEFRSRNNTEALRLLQGAYKERPDAEIAAHLGEVLWSMGEHERAITVWAEGSKLNAENETLQETIKRLRGAP